MHGILISDGKSDYGREGFDPVRDILGTFSLFKTEVGFNMEKPSIWMLKIVTTDKTPKALLENAEGQIIGDANLGRDRPWILRFAVAVATSEGYPAKECRLRLFWVRGRESIK